MAQTMQAAVWYGPFDLRMEEVPVPTPGPTDVLVKVEAALTCGTDVKKYKRGHPLDKPPLRFGHEFGGTVAAVGSRVAEILPGVPLSEGMRVTAANLAPCNSCFYCKRGQPFLCEHQTYLTGAFAEYHLIPEAIVRQNLLPIPEHLSFAEAAMAEPLATVLHGIDDSGIRVGDTVVVNGAGPIGLFYVRLAKHQGAQVICTDLSDERLAAAHEMGADQVLNVKGLEDAVAAVRALTPAGRGADVAIEAVGLPETWESTVKMVRKGGFANLFGGCASNTSVNIDTKLLHYSGLTIKGVFSYAPQHFQRALDLIARDVIPARRLITGQMPLDQAETALKLILEQRGIKYALIPPHAWVGAAN